MNGNQVRGKQKKYRLLLFENRVGSCDKSARDYRTISNVYFKERNSVILNGVDYVLPRQRQKIYMKCIFQFL